MKKRALSLLMAFIMVVGLLPTTAWAARKTFETYFNEVGLPATATNSTNYSGKWKVTTKDGGEVLKSGALNGSTASFTLTFTEDTHLSFEYKVSSGSNYNYFSLSQNDTELTAEGSKYGNNVDWTLYTLDVQKNDILKFGYKKTANYVANELDDCVYLRNFTCGTPIVVTFHANGGTGDDYTQNIYGGEGTLTANKFTKSGKVFAGWATSENGEVVYADGAKITAEDNTDLYAVWGDAYTVTFDYNDGKTGNATVDVAQDTAIGAAKMPKDPTKKGYTFEGWFNGETKLTAETVITGNVIYTAKWTPIRYTIKFDKNAADAVGSMNDISATYDEEVQLPLCAFTREGYTFTGWGSYKGEDKVKNLAGKDGAVVTLKASWRGLPVNVIANLNYSASPLLNFI